MNTPDLDPKRAGALQELVHDDRVEGLLCRVQDMWAKIFELKQNTIFIFIFIPLQLEGYLVGV